VPAGASLKLSGISGPSCLSPDHPAYLQILHNNYFKKTPEKCKIKRLYYSPIHIFFGFQKLGDFVYKNRDEKAGIRKADI